MRDPKRIPEILAELETYWTTPGHEEMRLGQIIGNFYLSESRPEYVDNHGDPYYFEDDTLLAALRAENDKER